MFLDPHKTHTLCGQNIELLNVKAGDTYSDHWALRCLGFVFFSVSIEDHLRPQILGSTVVAQSLLAEKCACRGISMCFVRSNSSPFADLCVLSHSDLCSYANRAVCLYVSPQTDAALTKICCIMLLLYLRASRTEGILRKENGMRPFVQPKPVTYVGPLRGCGSTATALV